MTRIANSLVRREIPKILGSSAAFIVVVVVLVVIAIASFSAVICFLRQERRSGDQEVQRHRRYNAQPLVDRDLSNQRHSKKWFSSLCRGSRDRNNQDKSMEGRMRANTKEWDINDFPEDHVMQSSDNQSSLLRMSENESSASSNLGPRFYTGRMHSSASDGASSVRYDPRDLHGLLHPEQFPILPQATIPSIESPLSYSPVLSSPSSPVPRQKMNSPEPISNTPSHDSVRDSLSRPAPGSGTKFFESF